jgi:hypothetical protein
MCTVTFIARKRGYLLGMNRDENRARPEGLPPGLHRMNGHRAIYPSEPGGGTWIGLNDEGVTLALINCYFVSSRVSNHAMSRGEIIPSMSGVESRESVDMLFAELRLCRINPFRLVGIFPKSLEVAEWQWDLKELARKDHPWRSQQWISSGFDEPMAQKIRSRSFRGFLREDSAGTSAWLDRVHSSHTPECGPFSTCMHRDDAATVSYTRIRVSSSNASLKHTCHAPCETSRRTPPSSLVLGRTGAAQISGTRVQMRLV